MGTVVGLAATLLVGVAASPAVGGGVGVGDATSIVGVKVSADGGVGGAQDMANETIKTKDAETITPFFREALGTSIPSVHDFNRRSEWA